jgi:FixJ family two-component response regulator
MAERTVYILDDDAVLRSLERLLSSASFEPIVFDNPDAFLSAAKTFKTGCVLLDVRLPGMSGLDVQTQLLKMRNDLAVIVVTGQGDIQTAVRAMKAGASDFLEKPYSDHALLGSIEMAFGKGTQSDRDRDIADAARRVATLSLREREVSLESAMDELAIKLNMDPVELRRINDTQTDATGKQWSSRSLMKCYDEASERFGWSKRSPEPGSMRDGDWLIG